MKGITRNTVTTMTTSMIMRTLRTTTTTTTLRIMTPEKRCYMMFSSHQSHHLHAQNYPLLLICLCCLFQLLCLLLPCWPSHPFPSPQLPPLQLKCYPFPMLLGTGTLMTRCLLSPQLLMSAQMCLQTWWHPMSIRTYIQVSHWTKPSFQLMCNCVEPEKRMSWALMGVNVV